MVWTISAIVVAGMAVVAFLILRKQAGGGIGSYGGLRRQIIDESAGFEPRPSAPPPRPPGLDTRLPAAVAATLRRSYPPTDESSHTLYDCCSQVVESIRRELQSIDPEIDWFDLLTQARRAVILADMLESEVNNGGFDQYYLNSSGDGASLAPAALRLLGQEQVARLVDRGNAVFPGGPPADRAARLKLMGALDEQAKGVWESLNKEFFSLDLPAGGLSVGAAPFILEHESEFFRSA
ncbi:MAG: DMP19 family protein [Phycisphaeraceae bacterium]|nr:DMP19 family protein [Phycisphaeraceae bacterium]